MTLETAVYILKLLEKEVEEKEKEYKEIKEAYHNAEEREEIEKLAPVYQKALSEWTIARNTYREFKNANITIG